EGPLRVCRITGDHETAPHARLSHGCREIVLKLRRRAEPPRRKMRHWLESELAYGLRRGHARGKSLVWQEGDGDRCAGPDGGCCRAKRIDVLRRHLERIAAEHIGHRRCPAGMDKRSCHLFPPGGKRLRRENV